MLILVHPPEACAKVETSVSMLILFAVVQELPAEGVNLPTSLLYHGFGIRVYRHQLTEYAGSGIVLRMNQYGENPPLRVGRRDLLTSVAVLPWPQPDSKRFVKFMRWLKSSLRHTVDAL